ncbi:MAG: DUF4145 domain-containing protein [Rhizobacter sp.]|nr:DUF4145 domain-containing protein [Rhizobacter sp.]
MAAEIVFNCPRCGAGSITLDVKADNFIGEQYEWMRWYEVFSVCRHCHKSSILVLKQADIQAKDSLREHGPSGITGAALNTIMRVDRVINISDVNAEPAPEHLPKEMKLVFDEGAKCLSIGCYNAAGTMFRMCVDIATRNLLPAEGTVGGPNSKQRRDLGLRLPWLFENKILHEGLHELASCIKEDGNDGAHAGTLGKADAEDMLDFTKALLERLFTEPERLNIAKIRRDERRQ